MKFSSQGVHYFIHCRTFIYIYLSNGMDYNEFKIWMVNAH